MADAIKTASKIAIQATGDLIGNKIADKITSVSKKKFAKASQLRKYTYLPKKENKSLKN